MKIVGKNKRRASAFEFFSFPTLSLSLSPFLLSPLSTLFFHAQKHTNRQEALLERVRRRRRDHTGRQEQGDHRAAGRRDAVLRRERAVQPLARPVDAVRPGDAQPGARLPAVLLRPDAQLRVEQGELELEREFFFCWVFF